MEQTTEQATPRLTHCQRLIRYENENNRLQRGSIVNPSVESCEKRLQSGALFILTVARIFVLILIIVTKL
ncbi:hypothetical protein CRE_08381 [Caenorhabditis remanei]|uniref:Uncharacterized protein n=1 Tax=Caenorhabditis remanei TaxID=31234 RepID=E3MPF5_CAERE|nr:hypothetical protein CRE_08381 [Caenorhabditis remanei]